MHIIFVMAVVLLLSHSTNAFVSTSSTRTNTGNAATGLQKLNHGSHIMPVPKASMPTKSMKSLQLHASSAHASPLFVPEKQFHPIKAYITKVSMDYSVRDAIPIP